MTLKGAAFFALIGMALLTVLLAVGFVRDVSASLAGAIAAVTLLASLIHLLASLSATVFFYAPRIRLTASRMRAHCEGRG